MNPRNSKLIRRVDNFRQTLQMIFQINLDSENVMISGAPPTEITIEEPPDYSDLINPYLDNPKELEKILPNLIAQGARLENFVGVPEAAHVIIIAAKYGYPVYSKQESFEFGHALYALDPAYFNDPAGNNLAMKLLLAIPYLLIADDYFEVLKTRAKLPVAGEPETPKIEEIKTTHYHAAELLTYHALRELLRAYGKEINLFDRQTYYADTNIFAIREITSTLNIFKHLKFLESHFKETDWVKIYLSLGFIEEAYNQISFTNRALNPQKAQSIYEVGQCYFANNSLQDFRKAYNCFITAADWYHHIGAIEMVKTHFADPAKTLLPKNIASVQLQFGNIFYKKRNEEATGRANLETAMYYFGLAAAGAVAGHEEAARIYYFELCLENQASAEEVYTLAKNGSLTCQSALENVANHTLSQENAYLPFLYLKLLFEKKQFMSCVNFASQTQALANERILEFTENNLLQLKDTNYLKKLLIQTLYQKAMQPNSNFLNLAMRAINYAFEILENDIISSNNEILEILHKLANTSEKLRNHIGLGFYEHNNFYYAAKILFTNYQSRNLQPEDIQKHFQLFKDARLRAQIPKDHYLAFIKSIDLTHEYELVAEFLKENNRGNVYYYLIHLQNKQIKNLFKAIDSDPNSFLILKNLADKSEHANFCLGYLYSCQQNYDLAQERFARSNHPLKDALLEMGHLSEKKEKKYLAIWHGAESDELYNLVKHFLEHTQKPKTLLQAHSILVHHKKASLHRIIEYINIYLDNKKPTDPKQIFFKLEKILNLNGVQSDPHLNLSAIGFLLIQLHKFTQPEMRLQQSPRLN